MLDRTWHTSNSSTQVMSELRTDTFPDTSTYSKVYIETTYNRNISTAQCTPAFDSSVGTVDYAKRPEDRGTEVWFPGKATVLSHFISKAFTSTLGHARLPMQLVQESVSTGVKENVKPTTRLHQKSRNFASTHTYAPMAR